MPAAAPRRRSAGAGTSASGCQTRDFIAQFEIVAAFDAAPVPARRGAVPTTPAPSTTAGAALASTATKPRRPRRTATRLREAEMSSANRMIVAMLVVAGARRRLLDAAARPEAPGGRRPRRTGRPGWKPRWPSHRAEAAAAAAARRGFPADYQQLVVLGKAVPESDDTSSLLVQLNRIAGALEGAFDGITVGRVRRLGALEHGARRPPPSRPGSEAPRPPARPPPGTRPPSRPRRPSRRPRARPRCCRSAPRSAPPGSA